MLNNYIATFSIGKRIRRKSENEYNFAWAVINRNTKTILSSGFCKSKELANIALTTHLNIQSGRVYITAHKWKNYYQNNKNKIKRQISLFDNTCYGEIVDINKEN